MSAYGISLVVVMVVIALAALAATRRRRARTVVAVIGIPASVDVPRERIIEQFELAAPDYASAPGLLRTYFTLPEGGGIGAIQLWSSRESAESFYNHGWSVALEDMYGEAPTIQFLAAPVLMEDDQGIVASAEAVVSTVRVKPPWYAPKFLIRRRFEEAVPDYQEVPGLLYKYFIIAEDGRVGGVYLWESRRAGEAFYDDAWHARIRETYGEPGDLRWFDAPRVFVGAISR